MKKLLYFLLSLMLSLSVVVLTSCENFMDGSDVQSHFEELIDIANAKSYTIIVSQDEAMGSFLSSGDKDCKVGYTIDLQFTVNSENYIYKGLEAVSKNNQTRSRADCVEFIETSSEVEEKNGIYKVQVKLLKDADDVMIKPKCVLIPKVTEITPVFLPSGYDQDSSIEITFNKSVNPASFGDFSCISIFSDETDLKDYFEAPTFVDDNTKLVIAPKQDCHIITPDSGKIMAINLSLNFTNEKDVDGQTISGNKTHQYRINEAFGNREISTIQVREDENSKTGTFDRTGEVKCTVGYSFNLQFTLKKADYVFSELEAVSKTNDAAFNASEVVEFETIKRDDDLGIYTVQVKIKAQSDDILIKPKCILIPKVNEITPASILSGCNQDETITIEFNKSVDPETFGDFSCISIFDNDGNDLKNEYFDTPVFYDDNTRLKITPKKKILPPDSGKKKDINIRIDFTGLKDGDGLSIESYPAYSYKINDSFKNQQISEIVVEAAANNISGTFDKTGQIQCSVGYDINLQFKLNKADYIFNGLNVERRSSNATTEFDPDDVTITYQDTENTGVYDIVVHMNNLTNNIKISPDCSLIPRITQITPAYVSTGCLQDEPIEIKFNKAVDPETFGDFECISIFADGEDLKSEYFDTPVFNTNNRILKITPKQNVHIIKPDTGKKKDLNIKIDFTNLKDEEGISIESYAAYSYRINDSFSTQRRTRILVEEDTNAETGTFVRKGEIECTVDNGIDLIFTVKKSEYIFKELVAVNSADRATPLSSSIVEFEVVDIDNDKGIYTIRTTVKNDEVGILIKPKCSLIPKVVAVSPAYDAEGCEQDSIISIEFNKPIRATEFFSPAISDAFGTNLAEYFDKPYYSDDSKTLYVPTVNTKRILDINGTVESKDIIVKIDLSNIKDLEGNFASGVYQHKYRINRGLDSEKPTLNSVTLYPTSEKKKTLTDKAFEEWNSTGTGYGDFGTNHIRNSVYIEADGEDADSGIAGLIVKEKLIKYSDGSSVAGEVVTTHLDCTKDETSGKYCVDYIFDTSLEGVVELKIQVEDYAGNISDETKIFYLVKDNMVDSTRIKFTQEISQLGTDMDALLAAVPVVTGDTQDVVLTLSSSAKDIFYGNYSTDFDIDAYWGYAENDITEPMTKTNNTFTFTRDVTKFVFIKLICKDAIGNEKEIIKRMAPRIEIYKGSENHQYNMANLRSYLMNCNISAGSNINVADYAMFLYQFYNDPQDIEKYSEVLLHAYYSTHFSTNYDIYWEINQLNNNANLDLQIDANTTGKLYMVATVGDFFSPRSNNFVKFDISNADVNEGWAELGEDSLSTGIDESDFTVIKAFGPEGKPYIKDGFKVTTEGVKNSGTHKVVIDDYMTQAGKDEGIEYSFYVVNCRLDENGWIMDTPDSPESPATGHEAPVFMFDTGNAVNSNIPEMFLNSTLSYRIYISATDTVNKKKYVPFEFKELYYYTEGDGMGSGKWEIPFSPAEGEHMPESCSFYVNSSTELTDSLDLTGDYAAPYLYHDSNPFGNPIYFEIASPADNASGNYGMSEVMYGNTVEEEPTFTLYKNADGKYELTYYIIPNVTNNIRYTPTYTINELKTLYKAYEKTIEYEPNLNAASDDIYTGVNKIRIYYGTLKEGLYTISFITEDIYGNAAVYTYPFINSTLGIRLPFTKEYQQESWEDNVGVTQSDSWWNFTIDNSECDFIDLIPKGTEQVPTINAKISFAHQPLNGPEEEPTGWEWEANGDDLCYDYEWTFTESGYSILSNDQIATFTTRVAPSYEYQDLVNRWARVTGYYGFVDSDSAIGKGYFYTDYVFMGRDDVCNVKNCMEGMNGIQVFFDNNVLVHTMYSEEKLTNSKYDKDAYLIWETKGLETGLDIYPSSRIPTINYNDPMCNPSSPNYIPGYQPEPTINESAFKTRTYGLDNYSDIPDGYWYTTIFHFADGTIVMTDIKQK